MQKTRRWRRRFVHMFVQEWIGKTFRSRLCLKFITPALEHAGWDINDQVFMNSMNCTLHG